MKKISIGASEADLIFEKGWIICVCNLIFIR